MNSFFKLKIVNCVRQLTEKIPAKQAGFTLLELMIVLTIATIMITTLVVQQSKWSDRLTVNTQTYELALMIRQAQIFSLGVREDTAGSEADKFSVGYGVHMEVGQASQYLYFADRDITPANDKNRYNASSELIETKILTKGVVIDRFCGIKNGVETCSPTNSLEKMDISFLRPDTKAIVRFLKNNNTDASGFGPPATIYLKSVGNKQYKITVEANGQVATTPI